MNVYMVVVDLGEDGHTIARVQTNRPQNSVYDDLNDRYYREDTSFNGVSVWVADTTGDIRDITEEYR